MNFKKNYTTPATWVKEYFAFTNGIPKHDVFERFFAALDREEFSKYFIEWIQSLRKEIRNEVIAIDRKCIKGSTQPSKGIKGLHFCIGLCGKKSACPVSSISQ